MMLKYETLESKEMLDQFEFAKKCLSRNSVSKMSNAISLIISSILTCIGLLYIISTLQGWIIALIIIVVVVNVVFELIRLDYVYDTVQKEAVVERNLYYARDYLTRSMFSKEVKLFNLYDFISNKINKYIQEFSRLQITAAKKTMKILGWTYLISGLQLFVMYGYVTYKCFLGSVTIGNFTMIISAVIQFSMSIESFSKAFLTIIEENKYISNYKCFVKQPSEYSGKIDFKTSLPKKIEQIQFNNVSFQYPNTDEFALEGFSFIFDYNKKYSIVGRNGAGKTTLVNLMMGLYKPVSGEILINKTPIDYFDYEQYLSLYATVFQDFSIWGYPLAENIAMSNHIDEKKIHEILCKAQLSKKVASLKNSYNTFLSREFDEDGTELSVGEKQKVALARVLYKDSPIFILDEPTASLSPQSEFELYENFKNMTKSKMVFFISHRLSSCKLCDEIIVLGDGKLVENGTHEQLMQNGNLYSEMFSLQAKHFQNWV